MDNYSSSFTKTSRVIYWYFCAILVGCGSLPPEMDTRTHDSCQLEIEAEGQFQGILYNFQRAASKYGKTCYRKGIIQVQPELAGNAAGRCMIFPKEYRIELSQAFLDKRPQLTEVLLFHELGHCALNRQHIPKEQKIAIMNPIVLLNWDDWDALVADLMLQD